MEISKLGALLADRMSKAQGQDRMLTLQLFGIEYASEIGSSATKIIEAAELPKSLGTELRQGIKIAPYVTLKA